MRLGTTLVVAIAAAPACMAQLADDTFTTKTIVTTTLDRMRAIPETFKNVTVRFPIQFCSIGRVSNPFFTRFVPSQYANFYAWSADQPIWRKESYDDLFGMLFLAKDSEQLQELYDQKSYSRMWVTGVVRNIFQGAPWIEVRTFEPIEDSVNTATLAHLYRAERHMTRREWNKAVSELSLAPAAEVPNFVRAAIHKNMGVCYLRMGEADAAVQHLSSATSYMDEIDRETTELVKVATEAPEIELDRSVDREKVRENERPMWEAFSESAPNR